MFQAGQKVVCIDDSNQGVFIRVGEIYTIQSISPDGKYLRVGSFGAGHYHWRFRPLVERKTDIGFAHEILRKVTKPAPVRAAFQDAE